MNLVVVQCPHCRAFMRVDPNFLTADTICPTCMGPLRPSDHVAPPIPIPVQPPVVEPLPARADAFEFDDEPAPRTVRNVHKLEDSFSTGFGLGFGKGLGENLAGCIFTVAAILIFVVFVVLRYGR